MACMRVRQTACSPPRPLNSHTCFATTLSKQDVMHEGWSDGMHFSNSPRYGGH